MHAYTRSLVNALAPLANTEKALAMKSYMKNQFEFLGIQTPERRKIGKHQLKQNTIQDERELKIILKELWMLPQREFQYCAIEILLYYKKFWQQEIIEVIEYLLTTKSWWDTVDFVASDIAGSYFKMFPAQIKKVTGRWNNSTNFWLQRTSLLFQKSYRKDTDRDLLADYIVHLAGSKEFFIQKAIGWVLREYAKTNPAWVKDFVNKNKLASLSQREATKHFN